MQISGKNLALVLEAIDLALSELHNQEATCPDVNHFAEDLDEIDKKREKIKKLRERIHRKQLCHQPSNLTPQGLQPLTPHITGLR